MRISGKTRLVNNGWRNMTTLNEIKQRIKDIAEGISGIGKVYDRFVYAFDSRQIKELFSSDEKINTFMF